jgi:hypothetical protein
MALERAIVRETAARARARGAYPLFVMPTYEPPRPLDEYPEGWILRELFVDQGVPFVVANLDHAGSIPGDGHPDAPTIERLGKAVEQALRAAGITSSAERP